MSAQEVGDSEIFDRLSGVGIEIYGRHRNRPASDGYEAIFESRSRGRHIYSGLGIQALEEVGNRNIDKVANTHRRMETLREWDGHDPVQLRRLESEIENNETLMQAFIKCGGGSAFLRYVRAYSFPEENIPFGTQGFPRDLLRICHSYPDCDPPGLFATVAFTAFGRLRYSESVPYLSSFLSSHLNARGGASAADAATHALITLVSPDRLNSDKALYRREERVHALTDAWKRTGGEFDRCE